MSTTALVHEAYLKLASQHSVHWGDKGQFFALAAQAMRRLLIDHARRYRRLSQRVRYDSFDADNPATDGAAPDAVRLPAEQRADELIALDEALNRLAQCEPRLAQVVECRFFAGYTEDETAAALDVNVRTVTRDWAKARAWLRRALEEPLE